MAMGHVDPELLPEEESPDVDHNLLRPTCESWRDVDAHRVSMNSLVAGEVLALEIGVDRHLKSAASSEGWYEVEGHYAPLLVRQLNGFLR